MNPFFSLLQRDILLALRSYQEWLNALIFFILVVSLFPLAISPDPQVLRNLAPGIIWVSALLASLLALNRLFSDDFLDGTLEQLLFSSYPLSLLVLAKVLAHWLTSSLPLIIIVPLAGILLHLSGETILVLGTTLLLGTPILSFIGAIGIALVVSLRNSGFLLALLVMPLYIPVLIFATSAVTASQAGLPISGQLAWLGALLLLSLCLAPVTIAAALRVGAE